MPFDLLDKLLIQTKNYTGQQIRQIIQTNCEEENVQMSENALNIQLKLVNKDSKIWYSINNNKFTTSKGKKSAEIDLIDIRRAYFIFLISKINKLSLRSSKRITSQLRSIEQYQFQNGYQMINEQFLYLEMESFINSLIFKLTHFDVKLINFDELKNLERNTYRLKEESYFN